MRSIYALLFGLFFSASVQAVDVRTGEYAYSSNMHTISVIDTTTDTLKTTLTVDCYPGPLLANPAGTMVYFLCVDGATAANMLYGVDTALNTIVGNVPLPEGTYYGLAVSRDGRRLYATGLTIDTVSIIDFSSRSIIATVAVGHIPGAMVESPDGARLYVLNTSPEAHSVSVIDIGTKKVAATILAGNSPVNLAINPAGTSLYVSNWVDNTISEIDTGSNTVIHVIGVGGIPEGITVSPDGTLLYVANYDDDTVSVINAASRTMMATIPVGREPESLSFNAVGSKVFVANISYGSVSVIDVATNSVIDTLPVDLYPYHIAVVSRIDQVFRTGFE